MYLIFDTETTTFPSKNLRPEDPGQARIVQLAWLLLSPTFEEVACFNSLIKLPQHVKISEGAAAAHGITAEDCAKYGLPIEEVIYLFGKAYSNANQIIAHNIGFDSQLIDIECGVLGKVLTVNWDAPRHYCTMQAMTPLCKLPFQTNGKQYYGRNNGQTYKWPKLQEAYQFCFQKEFEGAHDALADVRATAQIFRWLQEYNKSCSTPIANTSIQ